MGTRTTRSTRASSRQTAAASPAPTSKKSAKVTGKAQEGKENKSTVKAGSGQQILTGKARASSSASSDKLYCTCKKGDDGTPMINCTECKDWFHFSCIDLDETDAEDISVYVCSSCSEKTGLYSSMSWEESDLVEEGALQTSGPTSVAPPPRKKSKTPKDPAPTELSSEPVEPVPEPPSASEDSDDDDEYVAETKVKVGRGKHRTRRASYLSDSESSVLSDGPTARIRRASSPTLKRIAKRPGGPPAKKVKTSDPSDDPTRKYCLAKLEDVFRDIFLRYPHVRSMSEDGEGSSHAMEKQTGDLTEEERKVVLEDSKQFADDLEKSVFEIYSEPDKHGKPTATAKYKDRFRMLQFNLSKVDRVVLHKRIASGHISPKEISVMSSADLANEELKQSIKSAEQESLEQSILTKTAAPRTKITHKGLEDIEDVSGRDHLRERERQLEEEERMERERLARLRTVQPRQRTTSVSVPPESPVVPSSESWGAPPPVPAHALDTGTESLSTRPSLFVNTSPELAAEPELNLADLINIDDEPGSGQDTVPPTDTQPSSSEGNLADAPSTIRSPTGISPFAIQPILSPPENKAASLSPVSTPRVPAFNLNSLWSLSTLSSVSAPSAPASVSDLTVKPETPESKDVAMDSVPTASNDQDFDMFLLEEKEPETPETIQATFDALPQVWTGKINMPLDSATPQEATVVGRQIGGKSIEATSGKWKTLFPSDTLRIDGRVPVEDSAKFLLQIRMNLSKELVAVAFSPAPGTIDVAFKALSEFLINKRRHGLVFPWGNRPKDFNPGKELYIIPLLATEPLPDYIELLDDLRLPKTRLTSYFIGIWILNKGKLSSPPPQATPVPALAPVPSLSTTVPALIPTPTVPTPVVDLPLASLAATLPTGVDRNALIAELASLTPEQLAYVTQTLAGAKALPPASTAAAVVSTLPPNVSPPGPNSTGAQIPMPVPLPIPTSHQWGAQMQPHASDGLMMSIPPSYGGSERGGGGNFNSRGGRARGGRGRDRGREPVDSGWPRKNSGQRR